MPANNTHKLFSSRVQVDPHSFIGEKGRIFYNEQTGEIRLSDGITPYGLPIYVRYSGEELLGLERYTENGTPLNSPIAMPGTIALGDGSLSRSYGGIVQSSGIFTNPGDAQSGKYILRGMTSNSTSTELFLDGSSSRIILPNNSAFNYLAQIVAIRTDQPGYKGAWRIEGLISRESTASTTSLIGNRSKNILTRPSGWDVEVFADTTNGALTFSATGAASQTIRWVISVLTAEVVQ
jgi:hypothetical protein